MIGRPRRFEVLLAALAGITGVAGSYAVAGYTRQFVVAPIDAQVVRLTPGPIVAWAIENLGETGHLLHVALSVALAVGLFGGLALGGILAARRLDRAMLGIGSATLPSWIAAVLLTGEAVLALGAALPVMVVTILAASPRQAEPSFSRRRVLAGSAGALGFSAVSIWAGSTISAGSLEVGESVPGATVPSGVEERFQEAQARELDIAGEDVPGLVSSIGNFYNVDIAEFEPELPAEDWSLRIGGAVDEELTIGFDELTERPVEHRFVTLRCVGEDRNGRQMDTAVWTGTPIEPLLSSVDPGGACGCAMLRAEDGYYVQFPVEALEDAFLAWGMNGKPLPKSHGHPVRVLVPGHWGETNVKWLDEIELLETEMDGYWEERGWHGTGPVNTVAKLWDVTDLDGNRMELAGHAYAGTRGIERVEVSTDGGDTWNAAELSDPLPDADVWRQWRYEFVPEGTHDAVVRAVDGEGTRQPRDRSEAFPSGATGWVRKTVTE